VTRSRWFALLLLLALRPSLGIADEDVWTGVERVVAVGDVHGDHDQLVAVLRSAALIDAGETWIGGKAHLVQTGDVLDRGPDSRKAMDLLMKLEGQAREAGGRVHCLIGNHEAMNLYGDLRYVAAEEIAAFRDADSEKAREELYQAHLKERGGARPDDAYRKRWDVEHPLGFAEHRRAFSPAGKYGPWIRAHNAVLKIDGTLFLHGGISPKYAAWTVRQINEKVRAELGDPAKLERGIVQDVDGPLWYRGLARGDEKSLEAHVAKLLETHQVERIAIGHTYTDGAIVPRCGAKVIQIDVGLARYYDPGARLACLVIDNGKLSALHRGKKLDLPRDSGPGLLRYYKEAAALDPPPSPLLKTIAELDARK
jgi:hypothetical protein